MRLDQDADHQIMSSLLRTVMSVLLKMSSSFDNDTHLKYLRICLDEARKSPPKPSNFCVGALILHYPPDGSEPRVLVTGYTLECEGNTHAEQCCFQKLAEAAGVEEEKVIDVLPQDGELVLYTSMEPCWLRLSGNMPCVQRILRAKLIERVVCGVKEPEKFVGENQGRTILANAGINVHYAEGLEDEILKVATAGHVKHGS
jgi:pyrimidine deaminase RibD-like protein